jgi:hypothetical protein
MPAQELRIHPPRKIPRLEELPANFWDINRLQGGKLLDDILAQNIPFNSHVIDRTEGFNHFISHKSTDLRRKPYQNMARLRSLGKCFVRTLASYKGEVRQDHKKKATYFLMVAPFLPEDGSIKKTLEWYIPRSGVSEQQELVLTEVTEFGTGQNVNVAIIRI